MGYIIVLKRASNCNKSGLTTYKVTYRYAGNGVIAYDYKLSEFDSEAFAKAAIAITAVVVITAITFGAGAGAGAGVGAAFVLA